ncbi:MAG: hypothetical protein AAFO29_20870 [Actinomycetota bacterium]
MELTGSTVFLLALGALFLALIAVLVDRLNFPQARFRGRQVRPSESNPSRDRTGAHILDVESFDAATERLKR